MIDFTTLQGLTIPEGVVTQITDESGRVIWAVQSESGEPIVLEVEKIAITSYAGETSYSDNCVLLDIYPKKSNSTVKVTYGGLTKTLTFSGTNAQQVFFGTFNGVSDSVETAASGTLTIEGGCSGFACGVYQRGSKSTNKGHCSCITAIVEWGTITHIYDEAFYGCKPHIDKIPEGIVRIGAKAFWDNLTLNNASITLPSTLEWLYLSAFAYDITVSGDTKTSYRLRPANITMLSSIPPTLSFDADLIGADDTQFIVPKGCGEAYKTAEGWSTYVDKIVEAS